MEGQDKTEVTDGAYVEQPKLLEFFFEILVKIILLLLLICVCLIAVFLRVVYGVSLVFLKAMVAVSSAVTSVLETPIGLVSSTVQVLLIAAYTPIETGIVVFKLIFVSVIVGFGIFVEMIRLSVRHFSRVVNGVVSTVRFLVGFAIVLTGLVAGAVTVSLVNLITSVMLITRLLLFIMLIAFFNYLVEPEPIDSFWAEAINFFPTMIKSLIY